MTIGDWTHLAIVALIALPLATYGAIEWAGFKWAIRAWFERRRPLPARGPRREAFRRTVRVVSVAVATCLSMVPGIWPDWTSPGWIKLGGLLSAPIAMTVHAAVSGEIRTLVRRLFGGQALGGEIGAGRGLEDTADVPTVRDDGDA